MDRKYGVCMANNVRDTKYTINIPKRVSFVRNGENWKVYKIDWCEGGLKLADVLTNNIGEKNLNPRMKYIMVRLENW